MATTGARVGVPGDAAVVPSEWVIGDPLLVIVYESFQRLDRD
jgi:hypothetical protein